MPSRACRASGLCSSARGLHQFGYAIFGVVYWPILTKPEIDEAAARGKRVLTTL